MENLAESFAGARTVLDTSGAAVTHGADGLGSPLPRPHSPVASTVSTPIPMLQVADGAVEGAGRPVVIAGLVAWATQVTIGLHTTLHACVIIPPFSHKS